MEWHLQRSLCHTDKNGPRESVARLWNWAAAMSQLVILLGILSRGLCEALHHCYHRNGLQRAGPSQQCQHENQTILPLLKIEWLVVLPNATEYFLKLWKNKTIPTKWLIYRSILLWRSQEMIWILSLMIPRTFCETGSQVSPHSSNSSLWRTLNF